MIEPLVLSNKQDLSIETFVVNHPTISFFKDNKKVDVVNAKTLKSLLSECSYSIKKTDNGSIKAILLVWKSDFNGLKRNYIKVAYDTQKDLDDLLMMLNWAYVPEVYAKVQNNPDIISSFRKKGFRFCVDKGKEVLLFRSRNDKRWIAPTKEADLDE